jgi:diamine N-acetyltransferase
VHKTHLPIDSNVMHLKSNMDKLYIREANIEDYEALLQLYTHVDRNHNDAHPEQFKPANEIKRPVTYFEKLLSDINIKLLVACINNQVVGFTHAELREMNHPVLRSYLYGHISDVVVNPEFKRNGIGKYLFNAVEQWLKEKGAREISLTVFCFNNEAISFYKGNGFTNRHCNMVKVLHDKT